MVDISVKWGLGANVANDFFGFYISDFASNAESGK